MKSDYDIKKYKTRSELWLEVDSNQVSSIFYFEGLPSK